MEYLGYIIFVKGVAMDAKKVSTMLEWPIPTNVNELKGFLDLTRYYQRFI